VAYSMSVLVLSPTEEPAPCGLGPRAQRGRSHKIATGPMREMTAPEGAVTVSKDRPNKDFIGFSGERSTAEGPGTSYSRP
jgi:hypothetical protein